MNVLVACEESQEVCKAFRAKGHNAFSCDLLDCSVGHLEWHIIGDALKILSPELRQDNTRSIWFVTSDGTFHSLPRWDLIIAHPPCTYLTITGNRWFNVDKYGERAIERIKERELAAEFFMQFVYADCDKIAIENPIGYISTYYRKPDCIVNPYQFGDPHKKATCLWLKNLPPLQPTNIVEPEVVYYKNGKSDSPWHMNTMHLPKEERSRLRSKTFPGIAKAMADQCGGEA